MSAISTDTIVTAELLAGLDKCPFCGASDQYVSEEQKIFDCDSGFTLGKPMLEGVEKTCLVTHERDTLRARVSSLEAQVQRLIEAGGEMESRCRLWTVSSGDFLCEGDLEAVNKWSKAKEGV